MPIYQLAHFGCVYAAYGGIFILQAMLWGWGVDDIPPDRFDLDGSVICLPGVGVMMFWPPASLT